MWSINQVSEHEWEVLGADGSRVGDLHATYADALGFIGGMLAIQLAAADAAAPEGNTGDGLLPDVWMGVEGICFSEPTGDGRDFTGCTWSSRDPSVSLLPLMFQTSTDYGHFGAVLAGFIESIDGLGVGTTPNARGRFYDSETGVAARDALLDGRRFGVSVDPGRVTVEWVCAAEDEDGWCVEESAQFVDYEVIGLTMTPFPAFARAAIMLDTAAAQPAAAAASSNPAEHAAGGAPAAPPDELRRPVALAASARGIDLLHPPAEWFQTAEPDMGQPFALGDLGDEWLVDQGRGRLAMPLTITDDGRIAGHGAVWGQCHVGYPGMCVDPPESAAAYAHFHVGEVVTAEGSRLPVGVLSASCDHAVAAMRAPDARDSYAHNGVAWANVRITNGQYGPWVAGAIRHDVTEAQLAVLRAGSLSGDWRRIGGSLELVAMLAVSTPGFPIAREAITASGLRMPAAPQARAVVADGVQQSLTAAGIVRRCPECARRAAAAHPAGVGTTAELAGFRQSMGHVERMLGVIERRTRHLVPEAAQHAASRITPRR